MTTADTADDTTGLLRPHAEQRYAEELAALAALDERPRPTGWRLSPWAVVSYIMGESTKIGRASCRERV